MSRAVFVDLRTTNGIILKERSDVCIVGAGAAGIYVAVQLAARGQNVTLIEAGNLLCGDATSIGFDAHFQDELYPGATIGRFFGVGGSTSRWGGQLVPHSMHDLPAATAGNFDTWRHIVQTVDENAGSVLSKLGWHGGTDFSDFAVRHLGQVGATIREAGFDALASLFLPFRHKNLAFLLREKSTAGGRLKVIHGAVAKSWILEGCSSASARFNVLQAISINGNELEVSADRFVIAAGAIESARILLEVNDAANQPVIAPSAKIGCSFSDHLSVSIAEVAPASLHGANKLFAPRFVGHWMRSTRFIERDPPPDVPKAFSHFIFDNQNPGFALAKEFLFAWQRRSLPSISLALVGSGMSGIIKLAYKRYFESVLHIPPATPTHLQLDIEQSYTRDNRILLGSTLDGYGRRVADIRWKIDDLDVENIRYTGQRILHKWPGKKAGLPDLLPKIDSHVMVKPHDAYHPVATCRIGNDSGAVVDKQLKVRGTANLWAVSTGVLPSAGTANPTFTMLCLAENLVHHFFSK